MSEIIYYDTDLDKALQELEGLVKNLEKAKLNTKQEVRQHIFEPLLYMTIPILP